MSYTLTLAAAEWAFALAAMPMTVLDDDVLDVERTGDRFHLHSPRVDVLDRIGRAVLATFDRGPLHIAAEVAA